MSCRAWEEVESVAFKRLEAASVGGLFILGRPAESLGHGDNFCGKVICCDLLFSSRRIAANRRNIGIMNRVTCNCGAVYQVIESEGHFENPPAFKCVLCEKELFTSESNIRRQFHLIEQPEPDRE
jgi:hypothetical protein